MRAWRLGRVKMINARCEQCSTTVAFLVNTLATELIALSVFNPSGRTILLQRLQLELISSHLLFLGVILRESVNATLGPFLLAVLVISRGLTRRESKFNDHDSH